MESTEIRDRELKYLIEDSVDESVERAFRKYGRTGRGPRITFSGVLSVFLLLVIAAGGVYWYKHNKASEPVTPVENHDLTLENNGIFGFTAADFQEPILGEATRQRLLIVEEQEVYVNTTITETGFLNWGVFNKQQPLTIHGTGEYTVDLAEIEPSDIVLNEDTYELTISIPHAELHNVDFDPGKTEVGDAQNGWLAFGDIKLTAEQQKEFEVRAKEELTTKLSEDKCYEEADRFAKLSTYETYQAIVKTVSPAYKVVIQFKDAA